MQRLDKDAARKYLQRHAATDAQRRREQNAEYQRQYRQRQCEKVGLTQINAERRKQHAKKQFKTDVHDVIHASLLREVSRHVGASHCCELLDFDGVGDKVPFEIVHGTVKGYTYTGNGSSTITRERGYLGTAEMKLVDTGETSVRNAWALRKPVYHINITSWKFEWVNKYREQ